MIPKVISEPQRLNGAKVQLQRLIAHINLPPTGVTKAWLQTVHEVHLFATTIMEEHGLDGAKMVEGLVEHLKPTGKGAWAIRHILTELSITIGSIEHDLRQIGFEQQDFTPRKCDRSIGLWSWVTDGSVTGTISCIWDDVVYELLGVSRLVVPDYEFYRSLIVTEDDRKKLDEKAEQILQSDGGLSQCDVHDIKRYDTGEIHRIFIHGSRHILKNGMVLVSGYLRDVTNTTVIMVSDAIHAHQQLELVSLSRIVN